MQDIDLEQKLAKEIQAIYAKLLNGTYSPIFTPILLSIMDEEVGKIIAKHPDADIEKLMALLDGDDEYSLLYNFEASSNSEEEKNETVALGENSNEAVDP